MNIIEVKNKFQDFNPLIAKDLRDEKPSDPTLLLSFEVFCAIFQFLNVKELGRSSQVCRSWKSMMNDQHNWMGAFLKINKLACLACPQAAKGILKFESLLNRSVKKSLTKWINAEKEPDKLGYFNLLKEIKIKNIELGVCSLHFTNNKKDDKLSRSIFYVHLKSDSLKTFIDQQISHQEQVDLLNNLAKEILLPSIDFQQVIDSSGKEEQLIANLKLPSKEFEGIIKEIGIQDVFRLNDTQMVFSHTNAVRNARIFGLLFLTSQELVNFNENKRLVDRFITEKIKSDGRSQWRVQERKVSDVKSRLIKPETGMKQFLIDYLKRQPKLLNQIKEKCFSDCWDN